MKKILVLLLVFQSILSIAQQRRNNSTHQQRNNSSFTQQSKMQKFDAAERAGIFYYDEEKIIKKIKVKNETVKTKVRVVIREYNREIKQISFLKSQELKNLNDLAATLKNQNRNNAQGFKDFQMGAEKILAPIRKTVRVNEKNADAKLKEILTEKQFKNWVKYKNKQKKKLQPNSSQKRNTSANSGQMKGQGRGKRMHQ